MTVASNQQPSSVLSTATISRDTAADLANTDNQPKVKTPWQQELAASAMSARALLKVLAIAPEHHSILLDDSKILDNFPLRVTQSYLSQIKLGDVNDPLLRQILPTIDEKIVPTGYLTDPVGDIAANKIPGIIHKYRGRVLLIAGKACAIHCRYCFRRHFPYDENLPTLSQRSAALSYIANDPSINEVILSGGDPLAANDKYLRQLVNSLAKIEHVKTLRIHSRLPVVLPNRITQELLGWLSEWPRKSVVVIHSNHANELSSAVASAMERLSTLGTTLLNQSVLLKGINDNVDALVNLSARLFDIGVIPYYLHLLDRVVGAHHFEIHDADAKVLISEVSARLPGYLVPKLVREICGRASKTPI